jgi:hypothetical protein
MALKLPPWLGSVLPMSEVQRNHLTSIGRSWMTLSRAISDLTEWELLRILVIEIEGKRRPIIIARTLSRFRSLREIRENQELFECAADLGVTMNRTKRPSRAGA